MTQQRIFCCGIVIGLLFAMTGCTSFATIRDKADAGDPEMQYQTGRMLIAGDGIVKNPEYAEEYLVKAASQKHFMAACRLVNLILDEPYEDQSKDFFTGLTVVFNEKPPETLLEKHPIIFLPALGALIVNIPVYILTWGYCDISFGTYKTAEYEAQQAVIERLPEGFLKYTKFLDSKKYYNSAYRVCCYGIKILQTKLYRDKDVRKYLDALNSAKSNYEQGKRR